MKAFMWLVATLGSLVIPMRAIAQEGGFAIQPVAPLSTTAPRFAAAPGTDVGRYQIAVITDRENNILIILLDTKEGASWLYRPPQGNAINGYWSDIPRISYAPEFWRNVFNQQPPPAPASPATPLDKPSGEKSVQP